MTYYMYQTYERRDDQTDIIFHHNPMGDRQVIDMCNVVSTLLKGSTQRVQKQPKKVIDN